jgi:hypothetical protein
MVSRKSIVALLALGLLATPAAARERLSGEQELAKMLEGRVAGKPVSCVPLNQTRSTTIISKTAIVYDMGSTIYVNRPAFPQSLDSDDVMVTKTSGSQLCRLDLVELRARSGMFWRGSVGLEDFVPYTKIPKPKP